jgi:4-hydroxyphenylpyruvate dioxygenase
MTARDGLRSLLLAEAEALGADAMPARPVLDGIEFLEFAVDGAAHAELAGFLARLGFRHAGRHRSKAVDLYRQGRINLVLNAEPDSSAAGHFQLHGPSVCAMALRVDDVPLTLARAAALLIPDWSEQIGAGERRIPAIRGADGTLIYLVASHDSGRSFWEDDFHLAPGDDTGSGLTSVDHLALALPAGRMESHILFWRSLFGLELQPVYDLPDPYGLVLSRAMVDPTATLRVTFNISEARDTATNRLVSTYFGAGVHHIAFTADDAGAAVERLRKAAAPMLAIPSIYYRDLAGRLGLDDAQVAELERLGLLFDNDAGGEFRQAYTASFQERFFFEVVERRGAYSGFGAANAPVRMAAQARAPVQRS